MNAQAQIGHACHQPVQDPARVGGRAVPRVYVEILLLQVFLGHGVAQFVDARERALGQEARAVAREQVLKHRKIQRLHRVSHRPVGLRDAGRAWWAD